jgi:hypothetical protein
VYTRVETLDLNLVRTMYITYMYYMYIEW